MNFVKHLVIMYGVHKPSVEHIEHLTKINPSLKITVPETEQQAIDSVRNADIVFGHRYLRQCLSEAQDLRWVQHIGGGVDHLPCFELAKKNVILTRMASSSPIIARHAVTLAWTITRCLPQVWYQQSCGIWNSSLNWLPLPSKALVIGTGSIGRAIAKLLKNEGITVIGVKRTLTEDSLTEFDYLYTTQSLLDLLGEVDWCFLALPSTPETHNIFDQTVMRALPSHAILVNVGRGQTLVTNDLCQVLKDGHLGGAALDVIYPQPASPSDPIWQTPRLLITPWIAGRYKELGSVIEQFCEGQLHRFVTGQPLLNCVNLTHIIDNL